MKMKRMEINMSCIIVKKMMSRSFASRYDDDNHLYDIEDPAEWERLEEVLEDFNMHDEEETDDKCDGYVCEDGDCVTDCSECDKN